MSKIFMAAASCLIVVAMPALRRQEVYGQITSPADNSILTAGSDQVIFWKANGNSAGTVLLQYSTNGGTSWNLIASAGMVARSYDWIIPVNINSYYCMVRMQQYNGITYTTVASTGFFSVSSLDQVSTSSEVFSHRDVALSGSKKQHLQH